MLFRSFASFLLLASGAFALLVILVLAISVGAFGPDAQEALFSFWSPIQAYYTKHKKEMDTAVGWLGGILSAVTGTFAIYKSWYYAEFSLPRRLNDLIRRRNALLFSARPILLASVNDSVAERRRMTAVVYFYAIHRLLRDLGLGRPRYVVSDLVDTIDTNTRELGVVRARQAEIELEIVTGHLLKGCALASQATMERQDSSERRMKNEQALEEFKVALGMLADDIDALMFAARQSEVLGDEGSAINYLESMETAAALKEKPIRRAEAFRLKAEILAKRAWDDARRTATAGIEILDEMIETSHAKTLELVKTLIVIGEIQTKRERFTAARRALDRATGLLPQLELRVRGELQKILDDLYPVLDAAEKDREEPGE